MSRPPEGGSAFPSSTEGQGRLGFPPPALFGFLFLLVLMFGAAYAVGHAVGPVAPGMHGTGTGSGGGDDGGGGHDGTGDMGGMDMGHGSGG
ncbi:hypothetical protein AB0M42_28600 [Streptomyces sp. NPDC051784]|uniref:hypothetical protein n=1 Tax=Streptomyces sp. NPDC051784 TaxID=3155805 RepID=UPI0034290FAB